MRLSSNTEHLIMDGVTMIFTRGLIIKIGQSLFSKFLMETALVVSPHSHGIKRAMEVTIPSPTTNRFSSISPAPASSPANIKVRKSTVLHIWVLASVQREEN